MNFLVFSSVLKCIFTLAFLSIQKCFLPCHFSASRGCNFLAFLYHFPTSENAFYVSVCKSMYSIFSSMAAAYLVALFALFCVRLCVQRCVFLLQRCIWNAPYFLERSKPLILSERSLLFRLEYSVFFLEYSVPLPIRRTILIQFKK